MRNTLGEEKLKEKYKTEDEQAKVKIEAKNGLENYCFTMRNTLGEEKLKEKFEAGDKEKIEKAVQDTLDWLDKNQVAEKDECEAKLKEKFEAGDKEKIEKAVQ